MKEKEKPLWKAKTFWLLTLLAVAMASLALLFPNMPARAGPPPAPTPIAATAGGNDWIMVSYLDTNTIDIDINGGGKHTPAYTVVDLQHVIDVSASGVNSASCYLDYSNDNTNWVRGPTLFVNKYAATNDMQQYNLFGRYSWVTCTLSNTSEITITVLGKLSQN